MEDRTEGNKLTLPVLVAIAVTIIIHLSYIQETFSCLKPLADIRMNQTQKNRATY